MQGSKLYVGNLSYSVTDQQLRELFSNYGEVKEVRVIPGRDFGFVEMGDSGEAERAQQAMDGCEVEGRSLKVAEAQPPRSGGRPGGGGGRPGGGGGYGGNRGGRPGGGGGGGKRGGFRRF